MNLYMVRYILRTGSEYVIWLSLPVHAIMYYDFLRHIFSRYFMGKEVEREVQKLPVP